MFNHDTQLYYTLKIGARDGGSTPLEEEAVIYVQVRTHTLALILQSFYEFFLIIRLHRNIT